MPPSERRQLRLAVVDKSGFVVGQGDGLDVVASFFDMDAFGVALRENEFDGLAATTRLVELCKSTDERIALGALKEIRAKAREMLELNGVITEIEQTASHVTDHGVLARQATRTKTLLTNLKERNRALIATQDPFQVATIIQPEATSLPQSPDGRELPPPRIDTTPNPPSSSESGGGSTVP